MTEQRDDVRRPVPSMGPAPEEPPYRAPGPRWRWPDPLWANIPIAVFSTFLGMSLAFFGVERLVRNRAHPGDAVMWAFFLTIVAAAPVILTSALYCLVLRMLYERPRSRALGKLLSPIAVTGTLVLMLNAAITGVAALAGSAIVFAFLAVVPRNGSPGTGVRGPTGRDGWRRGRRGSTVTEEEREEDELVTRGAARVWYWSFMLFAILMIFGLVYAFLTR
jgi:hypothetical protein